MSTHVGSSDKSRGLGGLGVAVVDVGISNPLIHSFSGQYRITACGQEGLLPTQENTLNIKNSKLYIKRFLIQLNEILEEERSQCQRNKPQHNVTSASTFFHT